MKRVITWFAENGVAANLLMVFIIAIGVMTIGTIRQEVFPEFSTDVVSVVVPYPGAAPEEVEEGVVIRVEEAVQDLEGIKRITSTANENAGAVLIEIDNGVDINKMLNDVKGRVDGIDTFPEEAEEPQIEEVIARQQTLDVAISGDADERSLKRLGERVRDDLVAIPGITQVVLAAVRPDEISIEVSEEALRRYGLTLDEVANAVRRSSIDLPGGKVETAGGEVLLRTEGQVYRGTEFEQIPIRTSQDGRRLLLGEVAHVVDGFADADRWSRFNGKPAVVVQVFRVGDQAALDIAGKVREYVETMQNQVPEGIELTVWQDNSLILRSRLDTLISNGRTGFILVLLVLALFLKLRLAGWVSLGIPISFLGAFAMMPHFGVSVNLLSLFAFIVVLGIVVDDAIIVGENIYSHFQRGSEGIKAAVDGAYEVGTPVVFAVLTSVAAFAPLLMVSGVFGKLMRVIPVVVICCLAFSLIESLLVLPNHLSHLKHGEQNRSSRLGQLWQRVQRGFSQGLERVIERGYRPLIQRAIAWRVSTVAIAITLLMLTFSLVTAGWIKFNFFPPIEADNVAAYLTMPQGTPASVTAEAIDEIERVALDLQREYSDDESEPIRHILTSIGNQPYRSAQTAGPGAPQDLSATHVGEVTLELAPSEERTISSGDLANIWRERVGPIADAVELAYSASLLSSGAAIDVQLSGRDIESLRTYSERLKSELAQFPGVRDITDTYRAGKQELELQITAEAEAAGLTQIDLARQVRQAFFGEEAQRIQRGRDDVKVMVRFPREDRRALGNLESMRLRTTTGAEIPFATAADVSSSRGPASIRRTDRNQVINVQADVNIEEGNANEIIAALEEEVLPQISADIQGVRASFEGEQQQQRDLLGELGRGFMLALLAIYALLAIPFKSYLQPLIVMSAIPFGIIGAIWGHIFMGMDLAILSMFGIVALTGVVVNDSLVMVDFINRSRRGGMTVTEAIAEAGSRRFRPILLTSLTTFVGLTPLILEKSLQAQFLIPMAVSLAFGVLFATLITLFLVPCLYAILEDLRALFSSDASRREPIASGFEAEPADSAV